VRNEKHHHRRQPSSPLTSASQAGSVGWCMAPWASTRRCWCLRQWRAFPLQWRLCGRKREPKLWVRAHPHIPIWFYRVKYKLSKHLHCICCCICCICSDIASPSCGYARIPTYRFGFNESNTNFRNTNIVYVVVYVVFVVILTGVLSGRVCSPQCGPCRACEPGTGRGGAARPIRPARAPCTHPSSRALTPLIRRRAHYHGGPRVLPNTRADMAGPSGRCQGPRGPHGGRGQGCGHRRLAGFGVQAPPNCTLVAIR
jgi:hypothetical protein